MISSATFRSFTDHMKAASAAGAAAGAAEHPLAALVRKIKPRDAMLVAGGAAAYHGGKRLVDDVRMGEQMRQGGGYY